MSNVGNYIVKLLKNIGHDNTYVSNTFIIHHTSYSAPRNSGKYASERESTVLIKLNPPVQVQNQNVGLINIDSSS